MTDRILKALGVADDAPRVDRLVAVIAAVIADSFDVGLGDVGVRVEVAAERHLRRAGRGGEPERLARLTDDLAAWTMEAFADRVSEDLIRETAEWRGYASDLVRDRTGLCCRGLGVHGTGRQVAAEVVYDAVAFAVSHLSPAEPVKQPARVAAREAAWLPTNGAGP